LAAVDTQRWQRVSPYLDRGLELAPGERTAWLAALRLEDATLAADVESLLDAHRVLDAGQFLEAGVGVLPAPPQAGAELGAYTLVEPIGRGGMGSVWRASRSDGRYEGQAAIKLLNGELTGRTGTERFKREGTILARLTHPHIARLIDAGVSATGHPYLVLEHIDGWHIDRYCGEHALGIDARVRLFLDVLGAVAHAHASLIVHRDLKPSNVLVTKDGQVKLLDFGIAKLLEGDQPADDASLTKESGAVLTPRYAAPEQLTGGVVTTATDVYALGVLLYELLCGHHPLGDGSLSTAEMVKAIVEIEPARMSWVAGERLRRRLQGDLDTIVAKAMKKNPDDRYQSVAEFADDLRRFVEHQPISARSDTVVYRAVKFVRRHRRGLAAAAAAVAIVAGLIGFYTVRLSRERDRAALQAQRASKVSELLIELLDGADPFRTPDAQEPTVRSLLDIGAKRITGDANAQPEVKAEVLTHIGRVFLRMGLYDKAQPLLEQALGAGRRSIGPDHVTIAQTLNELGALHRARGDLKAAQPLLEESLAMRRRLLGSEHKDVAVTLVELARVLRDRGLDAQAEPLVRESLAIRRKVFGNEDRETATSLSDLGLLLWARGNLEEAEALFRENLAISSKTLGPDHPNVAVSKGNLALVLSLKGEYAEAETLFHGELEIVRKALGEKHPSYAQTLNNLSRTVLDMGRVDEAQALLEQCLELSRPILKDDHPRMMVYRTNLARIQIMRDQPDKAEPTLRQVLQARQRLYPPTDWRIAQIESLLGASLTKQARYDEAEPLLLRAKQMLKPGRGAEGNEERANRDRLAALYAVWRHTPPQ
jgi:eukaryotic-like serine/threonine-protein kinase